MPFDLDVTTRDRVETKPEVFSDDGFIAWLVAQDPSGRYDYMEPGYCAVAMFARSIDPTVRAVNVVASSCRPSFRVWEMTPLMEASVVPTPWTYGAALTRALALSSPAGMRGK